VATSFTACRTARARARLVTVYFEAIPRTFARASQPALSAPMPSPHVYSPAAAISTFREEWADLVFQRVRVWWPLASQTPVTSGPLAELARGQRWLTVS
jgi:hypothetical protein